MRSRGSTPAFVGRVPELSALIEAFDGAAAGRAVTALVGGEAGVGKSRLVRELGAHARRNGARVLVGHCLDLEEGGLPYAPFVDILRTLERELPVDEGGATISPLRTALGSPSADSARPVSDSRANATPGPFARARVFELLLTLLDRLSARGPVVLVIEDVHWADRSTDDLITLLSTNARHLPLLVAVTYRTDDGGRRLLDLLAELTRRGVTQVRLRRLDRGEVVELASALLGTPPSAELAAGIADRSDGNPLFVEELVAAIADDPAAPMPPHLRDAVLSRVRRMPADTAATLRACAVGGRQVEHDLLARVVEIAGPSDPSDDELVEALRACVDHQLLVVDNELGGYRFRHALVHEAVLDEILPGELARLHRAYAQALLAGVPGGVGPASRSDGSDRWARLAHHWSAAGDYDAALGAAVRAGVAAERVFAVPEAHRYLEWSVRLWDRAGDPIAAAGCDRGELLARAADAASRAGAITRALTLVGEALDTGPVGADPVRAGLLLERRGWYLVRSGRDAEALEAYNRAVALVPEQPPSPARVRVVQAQGHALERAGRHTEARSCAEEAIALAQSIDEDEGQARHVLGLVLAAEGRTDEAIAQLHQAGQIAVGLGDLPEVAGAYVHLWRTLVEAGRAGDLVDLVFGFLSPGSPEPSPSLMGSIGAAALQQLGRWDEADRLLADGRAGSRGGPDGYGEATVTAVTRTLVSGALAVDRGNHDLARERLETARAWCHQVGDGRLNGLLHRALAELAIWQERFDDARREVATGLELLAHTGDPELEARLAAVGLRAEADRAAARARTTAARARRRAEPGEVAADLMERLDGLAANARVRNAPPTCETFAAHLTGWAELSRITGRPEPDRWWRAVATWDGIRFPYAAAYARYRGAEAALAVGDDRDQVTAELRGSHATATRLGAGPLATAIERLARRARSDLASQGGGPSPGDTAGGPALTRREAEVLALVAEGMTNRQIGQTLFISEKTASVHVSRLLAKLGAGTRGEAAAVARRRGLLGD